MMVRRSAVWAVWFFCAIGRGAGTAAPVPDVVLQAQAQELIHKVHASDFTKSAPGDRQALAKLLLAQGLANKDGAAAQYIALVDAVELAATAGDAITAVGAVDALEKSFSVEGLDLRRNALVRTHAAATPEQSEAVMRLSLETAQQAVDVDAFDVAEQMTNLAEASANKTRQVGIVSSIQVRLAGLRELIKEFGAVKGAFARLGRDEKDAEAHLVVGRFYALHKGQWQLGLPHLAAGSDAELSDLAARELAHPADGLAQAALGDAWWDYAEKSVGLTQSVVRSHAVEWYSIAKKTIQGVTLARIESRIAVPPVEKDVPRAVAGRVVDLMALVEMANDSSQGTWIKGADGLTCASSAYACLRLPYLVPEEYDLRARFTRVEGKGPVALLLAVNRKAFEFVLDISGEARFELVDKKIAKDNPTVVPVAVSNGRRYELTVEVRKDRVRALLDGKELVTWKTDYKDMSRYSVWKLGDVGVCGVGANNAKVVFSSVELVEVTGKGKAAR